MSINESVVEASGEALAAAHGVRLQEAVDAFKAEFPERWDAIRLCPLQHGVEDMIKALKD